MTEVQFHPQANVGYAQQQTTTTVSTTSNVEATEMAAFERGRMQGEMEAIRRMEADQTQLKQFPAEPVQTIQQPDVIEINRLTWLQRLSALGGEITGLASIIITIAWVKEWRYDFGWADRRNNASGDFEMWNTGFLCGILGLFSLAQAILMYRVLPLNLNPWMNRGIYLMWQSFAAVGFSMFFAALVMTPPDARFWGVDDWCYALAFFVWGTHFIYSTFRTLIEPAHPVTYEDWAEVNNKLTLNHSPEQRRDHSEYNQAGRTVYTPAPHFPTLGGVPAANANVGAEVPVAPGNAPRWAENPNTHSEDYFLLPRAKWAVCGFVAMGAAILMELSAVEHLFAAGLNTWSQGPTDEVMSERSPHSDLIGSLGVITLAFILMVAYAAMPPRTTLVKNGILTGRRSSISHTAETRLGNNIV